MAISTIGGGSSAATTSGGSIASNFMGVLATGYSSIGRYSVPSGLLRAGNYAMCSDNNAFSFKGRLVAEMNTTGNSSGSDFITGMADINRSTTTFTAQIVNTLQNPPSVTPTSVVAYAPWNVRLTPSSFYCAFYGNSLYLAGDSSGTMWSSTDGLTWTNRGTPNSAQVRAIAYGASTFVAVGWNGATAGGQATSTDGITWTNRATSSYYTDIVFGNGCFVAVANNNAYPFRSTDGITFNTQTNPTSSVMRSVAHNGLSGGSSMFVAVGASGTIISSPDGITWTQRTNPASGTQLQTVSYGNGLFVAVGDSSVIVTSPDGITWTQRTYASTIAGSNTMNFYGVAYGAGRWVAQADRNASGSTGNVGGAYVSTDGITWRPAGDCSHLGASYPRSLAYINNTFITTRGSTVAQASPNGLDGMPMGLTVLSSSSSILN